MGGKTVDTNSAYMAKFCFRLGIVLKKIEVIPDHEKEIAEAVRRMSYMYDFVVTSGGIGPTHDDITYQSIASAFSLPLVLHNETVNRMRRLSKPHPSQASFSWDTPSPALTAKLRMATLPIDSSKPIEHQVIYPCDDLWVPVCCVNENVHILPGIPRLFERLLDGLQPHMMPHLGDLEARQVVRIMVSTPLVESEIAGYLTELAKRVEGRGIKVGSYPRWGKSRNTVTLVGTDRNYMETLVKEVEQNISGNRVTVEGEDDSDREGTKL